MRNAVRNEETNKIFWENVFRQGWLASEMVQEAANGVLEYRAWAEVFQNEEQMQTESGARQGGTPGMGW